MNIFGLKLCLCNAYYLIHNRKYAQFPFCEMEPINCPKVQCWGYFAVYSQLDYYQTSLQSRLRPRERFTNRKEKKYYWKINKTESSSDFNRHHQVWYNNSKLILKLTIIVESFFQMNKMSNEQNVHYLLNRSFIQMNKMIITYWTNFSFKWPNPLSPNEQIVHLND